MYNKCGFPTLLRQASGLRKIISVCFCLRATVMSGHIYCSSIHRYLDDVFCEHPETVGPKGRGEWD